MTKPKSLGQIAYEADVKSSARLPWLDHSSQTRAAYERMAVAVARAVKRRGKGK